MTQNFYTADTNVNPELAPENNFQIVVGDWSHRHDVQFAVISNFTSSDNHFNVVSLHKNESLARSAMRAYNDKVNREVCGYMTYAHYPNSQYWLGIHHRFACRVVPVVLDANITG